MTKKYRIRTDTNNIILQIYIPSRPKKDWEIERDIKKHGINSPVTKASWRDDQYYPRGKRGWTYIIEKIVDDYIELPENDDLLVQLKAFPQAFEDAVKRIKKELEIVE